MQFSVETLQSWERPLEASLTCLIATLTEEGNQKVVRFPKELPIEAGSVSYEILEHGQVILNPMPIANRQEAWIALLDRIAAREPDPDFMTERPMNRVPLERNLFPDD